MASQAAVRVDFAEIDHRDHGVDEFVVALTTLSAQHGIGIGGAPVLFVLAREDYERSYHVDEASSLIFE